MSTLCLNSSDVNDVIPDNLSSFTPVPQQRQAIEAEGPTLIEAPPGTGKTSVLAWRVAHLVERGISPFAILAVTFSVRAARDLRDRLEDTLPLDQVRLITVATFHALGLRIVRESGHLLGYKLDEKGKSPAVARPERARGVLKQVLADAKNAPLFGQDANAALLSAHLKLDELSDVISLAKAQGRTPERYADAARDPLSRAVAWAYTEYQAKLIQEGLVDFDDLVLQPLCLLQHHAETCGYYQSRWQHVLVDEYQDTSEAQYALVRLIAGDAQHVTVIGDPRQSIYAFRGALGASAFERFRHDYPRAQHLHLLDNFRSTANIIRASEAMWGAESRSANAIRSAGAPIFLFPAGSEFQEAEVVVGHLLEAVSAGFAQFSDCAVLCRTNAQVRLLEKYLIQHQVPYVIVGERALFEHPEILGLLACLRLALAFTDDAAAFKDALHAFGWLPARLQKAVCGDDPELLPQYLFEGERLSQLADADRSRVTQVQVALLDLAERKEVRPAELLTWVLDDAGLGYQKALNARSDGATRMERVREVIRMTRGHATVQSFLDEIDALSGYDPLVTTGRDRVQLMTLHAAKGLEFRLVFFAGLEEGLVPHYFASQTERGLLEERRLAYVGMTRASDLLCLSFARSRNGRRVMSSRWLRGLPHIEMRQPPDWTALGQMAAKNGLNPTAVSLSSQEGVTP
jgi:DNA helicase-2/ATP-dependent DNA helicase PcrA